VNIEITYHVIVTLLRHCHTLVSILQGDVTVKVSKSDVRTSNAS